MVVRDENGTLDYEEEAGRNRMQKQFERALSRRPFDYPPELHELDVRNRFGLQPISTETRDEQ